MLGKETSGVPRDRDVTPQVLGAAPGGPSLDEMRAARTIAVRQPRHTFSFLIAQITRNRRSQPGGGTR